jgi:hypothetical protein
MMGWLAVAWRELIGLFIEDGNFALAMFGGALCVQLGMPPIVEGVILAVGFALLLAENVGRSARARNPSDHDL